MQKIFRFEMAVATKDRSKAFQLITLALFSFSLTVIVIAMLGHLTAGETALKAQRQTKPAEYATFVSVPAQSVAHLQK